MMCSAGLHNKDKGDLHLPRNLMNISSTYPILE